MFRIEIDCLASNIKSHLLIRQVQIRGLYITVTSLTLMKLLSLEKKTSKNLYSLKWLKRFKMVKIKIERCVCLTTVCLRFLSKGLRYCISSLVHVMKSREDRFGLL